MSFKEGLSNVFNYTTNRTVAVAALTGVAATLTGVVALPLAAPLAIVGIFTGLTAGGAAATASVYKTDKKAIQQHENWRKLQAKLT